MKLCWLLTTFQSDAASALVVSDKHVPACRFQSVSPDFGALVWFSCRQGWKWMVHYYCDVLLLKQLLPDIIQAAVDFCFPVQEHWAAVTQDSGLHTRHAASQQTKPQFCRLQIIGYWASFRNAFVRNSRRRQTSLMSCIGINRMIFY